MIPPRNAVPSRYPPVITWMLIAIDCPLFLFQDSLTPDELELFLRQFALIPARIPRPLHRGNLILNTWTLRLFGPIRAFSRARNERFGEGDVFRHVFERVVEACIALAKIDDRHGAPGCKSQALVDHSCR